MEEENVEEITVVPGSILKETADNDEDDDSEEEVEENSSSEEEEEPSILCIGDYISMKSRKEPNRVIAIFLEGNNRYHLRTILYCYLSIDTK
jgi:hypothetical protein